MPPLSYSETLEHFQYICCRPQIIFLRGQIAVSYKFEAALVTRKYFHDVDVDGIWSVSSTPFYISTQLIDVFLDCSLILSRIDYCNAVLHGAPSYSIKKLQRVQNNVARIVLEARRRSHVSPLLRTLHWLPVQQMIDYKLVLLTFKVRSTSTPSYLRLLI